ncbi:DUF4406 domain-containing protein [Baileyella intestinalis]|uniref:DUF4406 domain-containing protein n=1 Tax=Baileyella intestinalis TaxID=2606709 RepID=UPI003A87BD0D
MSKRVMISQPMAGRTNVDILTKRNETREYLKWLGFDEVVDTVFFDLVSCKTRLMENGKIHPDLYLLGRAMIAMSECDAVFFCHGWESARGCQIEHAAAEAYGLKIIHEKEKTNE